MPTSATPLPSSSFLRRATPTSLRNSNGKGRDEDDDDVEDEDDDAPSWRGRRSRSGSRSRSASGSGSDRELSPTAAAALRLMPNIVLAERMASQPSASFKAGEVTRLRQCCTRLLRLLRDKYPHVPEEGTGDDSAGVSENSSGTDLSLVDAQQALAHRDVELADQKFQVLQLQAELRRFKESSGYATVFAHYESTLAAQEHELAALRARNVAVETRALALLDECRTAARSSSLAALLDADSAAVGGAGGMVSSSSATWLGERTPSPHRRSGAAQSRLSTGEKSRQGDRDDGSGRSESHVLSRTESVSNITRAVSKQTLALQRMVRGMESKLAVAEKENKNWQRKDREHRQRGVVLDELAAKHESMKRMLDRRTADLQRVTAEQVVTNQQLSELQHAHKHAQDRVQAFQRELSGAVKEIQLNRQYVRQMTQESREKEVLYRIQQVRVHAPAEAHRKPLAGLTALTNELSRPQTLPNPRVNKLVAVLSKEVEMLALERDEAVTREKYLIDMTGEMVK